jgi:hypothetical protein
MGRSSGRNLCTSVANTTRKIKRNTHRKKAAFTLLAVDMVHSGWPICQGLCAHPDERFQQPCKRERETGITELPPFVFAFNLCIPWTKNHHQVSCYFSISNMDENERGTTQFGRLMQKFIFGDSGLGSISKL